MKTICVEVRALSSPHSKRSGFTLLEMMLVIAIMAGLLMMFLRFTTQRIEETRRDRLVIQMQNILNAGLSYYVSNGKWPVNCDGNWNWLLDTDLKNYLPTDFSKTPYLSTYQISCSKDTNMLKLKTWLPTITEAKIIAGRLPLATAYTMGGNRYLVESGVTIPGLNLNNARSVNFGSLYHAGACVPAPKCPTPQMKPQIIVVPVSISGVNDPNPTRDTDPVNVYPISSFTAYAQGVPATGGGTQPSPGGVNIPLCNDPAQTENCKPGTGTIDSNQSYWRVCLKVVTPKGKVEVTNPDFGKKVTLLAITRCAPDKEYTGGSFDVFSR